jgi:hypothetical protein
MMLNILSKKYQVILREVFFKKSFCVATGVHNFINVAPIE